MEHNDTGEPAGTLRGWGTRGLVRALGVVSGFGLAGLVGGLAVLYALQTRMIFPGSATQGQPEAEIPPSFDGERLTLTTASGQRVTALFGPALTAHGAPHPEAAARPTLLYFYGNGMCLSRSAELDFPRFRRLGFNVLVPDYVGYGLSGGTPGETGCYEAAYACYQHLLTRTDINREAIVVAGRSLGGAVAIDLASREEVAGLGAFCTFTTMSEMTRLRFPFAPTLLLRHKFDSLSKIARVSCPVLLGHGRVDRVVPAVMSEALAAAARAPATVFMVEGADHNDFYDVGMDQIHQALSAFTAGLKPR